MEELHTARPTHEAGDVPIPRPRKGALRLAAATAIIVVVFAAAAGAPWFGYLNYERDLASIDLNHARRAVMHSAIGLDLRAKAAHAANAIDSFLVERIVDARQIATTPKVVDATREGAWRHAQSGLTLIEIEEVEVLGGTARSRGYFPDVDAHLRHRQRISQYFDEISVTDEHGLNVAYSHPTSDFVQSDEDWWKVAWNTGIWIGEVAFDRSAVEPSIALATRFESATNGERLGVLKASINLRSIQDLMSNGTHGSPGLELTIFDPRGRILAETASEHATDRILAGDDRAPRVPPDHPSGYTASGGEPPVGFARTAGTTRYASAGARYAGLEWLVTATLDPEALTERRASLDHLADALARAGAWPDLALAAAVSSAAMGALAAFFTVWLVLRRVDADARVLDSLLESLEDGRDLWTDPPRSATFSGITERVRRVAGVGRGPT